jgi:hypothetical protein
LIAVISELSTKLIGWFYESLNEFGTLLKKLFYIREPDSSLPCWVGTQANIVIDNVT